MHGRELKSFRGFFLFSFLLLLPLRTSPAPGGFPISPDLPGLTGPGHGLEGESDRWGIPLGCGEVISGAMGGSGSGGALETVRIWEAVPGVIRGDGVDGFRLEVTVEGPVEGVELQVYAPIRAQSAAPVVSLRDDGLGEDRGAGDRVFTSELLRYDPAFPLATHFRRDPDSPAGLDLASVGRVLVREGGGVESEFLVFPSVGVLDPAIPLVGAMDLSGSVRVTPHLINVKTGGRWTQRQLRFLEFGLQRVSSEIYAVLPDAFDFLVFLSMDHVERFPRVQGNNFTAGLHQTVRVDYSGTGRTEFDHGGIYGSDGRLLGLNVLDGQERGLYSQNLAHELSHQWASFLDLGLSISEGGGHYLSRSSAASLIGGVRFVDEAGGMIRLDCEQGRARARRAPPLDKYLMGLIPASAVPPVRAYGTEQPAPFNLCGGLVSNVVATVTIEQIQAVHGERLPGPSAARRGFSIGFVAESHERFLTAVERTYYEILAAHVARPVVPTAEPPMQSFNWVPLEGYFGEGTTWNSRLTTVTSARFTSMTWAGTVRHLRGEGFPGSSYKLESTDDFVIWRRLGSAGADGAGRIEFTDVEPRTRFYRMVYEDP